ncbi:PREDICTED: olfactory receptor 6M1-like [Thamnophis sirtalis]|uniref:Olfactory receptor 6M1-like n=1 Tax=Thamnophis sirtalis TaxID=35019 RepID=A0A6I9XQ26_9SAUR|nr:PREDICTED: olfactory receptor 6M1-like [Thamnophis sirtalis]
MTGINTVRDDSTEELLREFEDVFGTGLSKYVGTTITFNLDPKVVPIRLKPWRVPIALHPKIDLELDKVIGQGIMESVDHAHWETPIVTLVKPDGSVHICTDTSALSIKPYNKVLIQCPLFGIYFIPLAREKIYRSNIILWIFAYLVYLSDPMILKSRENISGNAVTEFLLLGFSHLQKMQLPLFCIVLIMYVLALMGNALVVLMIHLDSRLHTPMYYFLRHLSWLEIIITTTVTPKMLSILISEKKSISFFACIFQVTLYFLAGATEVLLLGAMSVDRYLAICNPLRYTAIMSNQTCFLMVIFCWFISFVCITIGIVSKSTLPFCGPNIIDHFFCDMGPLTNLICADTQLVQVLEFASTCFTLLSSVSATTISYVCIIVTVIRMPSAQGRNKAFSTCSSHITVASIYYGSSIFIYVRPSGSSSMDFNKLATMLNTVVTPLLNPIIYSFRNKAVKQVLKDGVKHLGSLFAKRID